MTSPGAVHVEGKERLLRAIAELRTWRQGDQLAPHKPLMLLLALMRYRSASAPGPLLYSDIETRLADLIAQLWPTTGDAEPQDPFWRLKSSGVWELTAAPDSSIDFDKSDPPSRAILRADHVTAAFSSDVDLALRTDPALAPEAIELIITEFFKTPQRELLRELFGIEIQPGASRHTRTPSNEQAINALHDALESVLDLLAKRDQNASYWQEAREALGLARAAAAEVLRPGFTVKESAGVGNAAAVPWISIFPPGTDPSPRSGVYVVYLFAADGSAVYLSLNQAAEQLRGGVTALQKRARDLRDAAGPAEPLLPTIDLATNVDLGRRYAAGSAYAVRYEQGAIPAGSQLADDLERLLSLLDVVKASGLSFSAEFEPQHLVLKWSADRERRTIELHREVAQTQGSVWWAKMSSPIAAGMAARRLADFRAQLNSAVPTYVYLYRQGEVWRTTLEQLTVDAADVDYARLPSYYSRDECNLFVRLSSFEEVSVAWVHWHLLLASHPDPDALEGALSNQTNPVFVYQRWTKPDLVPAAPAPLATIRLTLDWLVEQTLWTREALEEVLDSLRDKSPQVILAGPPGTGKTFLANKIARYLTNDAPLLVRTVQFHPSYGYEEFVEGLRPIIREQALVFERSDGVILQMARAAQQSDETHVLIIDEMNRANLPRVFGELMNSLEYRDEPIDLLYSEAFSLPSSLFIVGTMNTADRSIRSIDVALRRRFDLFECPPDADILRRYYEPNSGWGQHSVPRLLAGFEQLNQDLTDQLGRYYTIGHSFFMDKDFTPKHLRRVWTRQIHPLLEEFFFDQPDVVAGFSLDKYWPGLAN